MSEEEARRLAARPEVVIRDEVGLYLGQARDEGPFEGEAVGWARDVMSRREWPEPRDFSRQYLPGEIPDALADYKETGRRHREEILASLADRSKAPAWRLELTGPPGEPDADPGA